MENNVPDNKEKWLSTYNRVAGVLLHPSSLHFTSLSPAQELWHTEIKNIKEMFALTAARYNDCAPVNMLPAEILSEVFVRLLAVTYSWSFRTDQLALLSLTRVCRRWRAVALQTAELWARVSFDGHEPLDVFLERSKGHPLEILGSIKPGEERHMQRMRELLRPEHLLRLGSLNINIGEDDTIIQLLAAEDTYFPKLESLDLTTCQTPDVLSPSFITSRAPRLYDLDLCQCFFPWGVGSSSLRRLFLHIEFEDAEPSFKRTLDDVLVSLAAMPNLERLNVTNGLPSITVDKLQFIDTHQVVKMPNLRYLDMTGDRGSSGVLWALLEAHPSAHMNLNIFQQWSTGVMGRALSQHTRRPDSSLFTHLSLHGVGERLMLTFSNPSDLADPKIYLEAYAADEDGPPPPEALKILGSAPMENLETLIFKGYLGPLSLPDALTLFTPTIRLRQLDIYGKANMALFSSLLLPLDQHASPTNTSIPLPALVEVRIGIADLTASFEPSIVEPIGECFGRALAFRHKAGHGLQRLLVKQCKVEKGWVEFWKTTVREVGCEDIY